MARNCHRSGFSQVGTRTCRQGLCRLSGSGQPSPGDILGLVRSEDDDGGKQEEGRPEKRVTQASPSVSGSRFGGVPAVALCLRSARPDLRSRPGLGGFALPSLLFQVAWACCFAGGGRARCMSLFRSRITATRHLGKEVLAMEEQENRHLWAELERVFSQWDSWP